MNATGGTSWGLGAAAVLAALLAIFVPSHFSRDPWNPDEPRYMEVARRMQATGQYFLPHLNGEIYAEKPPLFFWAANAGARATGSFVLGARAVSALAIALTALAVALLGRHLFDARTGVIGAAIFATSVLVVDSGQKGLIDPLFTCCATWATLGLVRSGAAPGLGGKLAYAALGGLAMAAGVLAKGPLAVAAPIVAAAIVGHARLGRRGFPIEGAVLGTAVAAAAGLGWLVLAGHEAGHDGAWYWQRMVVEQTVGRAVSAFDHRQPFWYYLPQIAWGFFPWILFLPAAAVLGGPNRSPDAGRRGLFWWIAILFVAFSIISAKRPGYILPLYPALALLVARRIATIESGAERAGALDRAGAILAGAAFLALGIVMAAFPAIAHTLPKLVSPKVQPAVSEFVAALPAHTAIVAPAAAVLLVALAVGIFAASGAPARAARVATLAAAAVAVASLALHAIVVPAIDPQKSARALGERVKQEHVPSEKLVLYPQEFDGVINFYTGAVHYDELKTAEELRAAADEPGRLWIVAHESFFRKLDPDFRARFDVRGNYRVGRRGMVLVAERGGS